MAVTQAPRVNLALRGWRVPRRRKRSSARSAAIRPEIQALRAAAVVLVVAYHLWPSALAGGFVGVDVFFAISGLLITSLLLREAEHTGTVSLPAFWARRARRILPAALVTVLFCAASTLAFVPVTYWGQFFAEMRASTAYVQNWHLAGAAVDYMAAADGPSPVQHFWSLSVEEQFYIVWPALILLATGLTRRRPLRFRRGAIAIAMATLAGLSLGYSVLDTAADPAAAYFVTPTRAWEFGVGGLLALAPRPLGPAHAWRSLLSWIGIAAIVLAALTYSSATRFPGCAALLPVLGALAVMWAGTPTSRWSPTPLLKLVPVQVLGDMSYSVYLWHWPLIVLAPFVIHAGATQTRIAVLMLTLLAAWLSKTLIEDPARRAVFLMRRPARWTLTLSAAGTAIVIALTACGSSYVHAQIRKDALLTQRTLGAHLRCFGAAARDPEHPCENPKLAFTVAPTPLEATKQRNSPCDVIQTLDRVRVCAFGAPPASSTGTIALVGDSHASHWRAALEVVADAKRWRGLSITHTGCPFSKAIAVLDEPAKSQCIAWNRETLAWFHKHPEVHTAFVVEHSGGKVIVPRGQTTFEAQVAGYRSAWNALPASVQHIVVIHDTPRVHADTFACIERVIAKHQRPARRCTVPRAQATQRDPAVVAAERMRSRRVQSIDMTSFFCDTRRCYPVIGGALVYKNIDHLTDVYAATLGPFLLRRIDHLIAGWKPLARVSKASCAGGERLSGASSSSVGSLSRCSVRSR
jgi:peptidoglycan/LPS O-acetylase OafA/YrhL